MGKEDVNGKPAFWMEMALADSRSGGTMYMKYLIAPGTDGMTSTRMIMQQPGQQPIEMDMNLANLTGRGQGQSQAVPSDIRQKAETTSAPRQSLSPAAHSLANTSGRRMECPTCGFRIRSRPGD